MDRHRSIVLVVIMHRAPPERQGASMGPDDILTSLSLAGSIPSHIPQVEKLLLPVCLMISYFFR